MMKQGRMDASRNSLTTIFYCVPPQPGGARMAEPKIPPILSISCRYAFSRLMLLLGVEGRAALGVAVDGGQRQWRRWGSIRRRQLAAPLPPLSLSVLVVAT
jgi:hypothetical protein